MQASGKRYSRWKLEFSDDPMRSHFIPNNLGFTCDMYGRGPSENVLYVPFWGLFPLGPWPLFLVWNSSFIRCPKSAQDLYLWRDSHLFSVTSMHKPSLLPHRKIPLQPHTFSHKNSVLKFGLFVFLDEIVALLLQKKNLRSCDYLLFIFRRKFASLKIKAYPEHQRFSSTCNSPEEKAVSAELWAELLQFWRPQKIWVFCGSEVCKDSSNKISFPSKISRRIRCWLELEFLCRSCPFIVNSFRQFAQSDEGVLWPGKRVSTRSLCF